MKDIISEELLSEVLNEDFICHDSSFAEVIESAIGQNNLFHINYKNNNGYICLFIINIHELAHKCKEYMRELGYMVVIYIHLDTVAISLVKDEKNVYTTEAMTTYTELEAIFKATQWILNHKEASCQDQKN